MNIVEEISAYVKSKRSIIWIRTFDFPHADKLIDRVAKRNASPRLIEYDGSLGAVKFICKQPAYKTESLSEFFSDEEQNALEQRIFVVLKDVDRNIGEVSVMSALRRICDKNISSCSECFKGITIFIVSGCFTIPPELERHITVVDIPLPSYEDILKLTGGFFSYKSVSVDKKFLSEISYLFKGFDRNSINQTLLFAYVTNSMELSQMKAIINREKEKYIRKNGNIELIKASEDIASVGGLVALKKWIHMKKEIIMRLDEAANSGIEPPKGVMILGVPGCGKSLTAKVIATIFDVPLLRLDIGKLMGKYIGESEGNMKNSLEIAEAISPCVLWVDEIEKAFAGVGGGSGHEVTIRLFGQFLTWLQEKKSPVFVAATANSVENLPVEFLRKGRFDEIFFVDLPNSDEREEIFRIQLTKRNKYHQGIDLKALVRLSEGFCGADIEEATKRYAEELFIAKKTAAPSDVLEKIVKNIKSISSTMQGEGNQDETMQNKIDGIRKKARSIGAVNANGEDF